jgi:hypothetical protein
VPRFNLDNYVDTQERINQFWEDYPGGSINSRLMSPPDDFSVCRYEATVYRNQEDNRPAATGYAFEIAGGGGANSTNHEENCETSAIGRALANMGYAKNRDERPSRQEMDKANRAAPPPPVDPETGEIIETRGPENAPSDIGPQRNKRVALYTLMSQRGITDDDRHLLGWALLGKSSSKTWTDPETERMHRWVGRHDPAMWQKLIGYLRRMDKAAQANSDAEMQAVATQIGQAGIDDDELRACFRNYRTIVRQVTTASA